MRIQKLQRMVLIGAIVILVLGPLAAHATAQTSELPRRTEAYSWSSGRYDGAGDGAIASEMAIRSILAVPGSPWMQLNFSQADLGQRSYVEITSTLDGATQRLDAKTLRQWHHRSAYFNGDAVEVSLFVDPQDRGVSIDVFQVVIGEAPPSTKSICGSDNRIASSEGRVARIDPIGCTGWIAENGKLLTAGHCLAGSGNTTLSFNPPQSLSNGTVQFPGPDDQYSINQGSFQFTNGGVSNDWGIFTVANNSQTGLQPIQAQGSFDVRQDLGPANIRITGFGVDSGSTNQTNQTHVGPNTGSSGTTMRYATDTQGGNSGSPIVDEATGESVGIHTHGGCSASGGNNNGTSFFNSNLWTALDVNGGGGGPGPVDCPAGSIDFDNLPLTSYSNQNASNNTTIEDDGDILLLEGNTWVRSTQTFNITANTVIDFMFASGSQGEIHAIGFDNNDTLNDNPRHFQFWGTQNWTGTGKIDLTPKYSGGGDFQSYSVAVGQSYTGNMWLAFTNDKDSGTLNNESRFACVQVRDVSSGCDVNESFESGAGGWTTSGTCSTGTFTTGTPDAVTNGGVTTQVGSAQDGSNALFTQPNTVSAGVNDVDGGECVATSPVYNVTANSDVSAWYYHGQRDAGDDPSGDFFFLEVSTNSGAWQSLASFGDVTSNASWTEATTTAAAGNSIQLRIRASDGAGPGDLVEAGIDNVSICAQ